MLNAKIFESFKINFSCGYPFLFELFRNTRGFTFLNKIYVNKNIIDKSFKFLLPFHFLNIFKPQ